MKNKQRGARRDRTIRVGERRRQQWVAWAYSQDERSTSVWRHAKRVPFGCNCRGRQHGNPKEGTGPCHGGHRPSAVERREGKRVVERWEMEYSEPV